ncbi:MAG: GNAT family N-acetyltransferase [Saprospiraceae bacterium]
MAIEKAALTDFEILTEITKKSKAFWGYSKAQIEIWSEQLTITQNYLETKEVYNLIIENKIVGYYGYFNIDEQSVKLDNLFILPEYIGKGLGRVLLLDFLERLRITNSKIVILDSEPFAENFYRKFGFVKIGQKETTIKDRYLPIMELNIND